MEHITTTCDIEKREHSKLVSRMKIPVMFDHDQDDGRSKMTPYFEMADVDICTDCFKFFTENKILPYAYGAMGYNRYYLHDSNPSPNTP
jgi:hypothetical protein